MKVSSKKHHIYAFRLSRKSFMRFFCIMLSLILGYFMSSFLMNAKNDKTDPFLKSAFFLDSTKENQLLLKNAFLPDEFLRQTLPVFTTKMNSVEVFNPKGADTDEFSKKGETDENLPKTKTDVIEKNVSSVNISITNATDYMIDAKSLVSNPISYHASSSEPSVLIMHTHGCETYSDENGTGLGERGEYRSTKEGNNVISIGEVISEELQKRGIKTIHDKTLCDYPSYNTAYKTGMGLNDWYLNRYPSIRFIFDIHRDAVVNDGKPVKLTTEINGEKCAQAMIVCGTDKLGLSHPHWRENLTLGLKIQNAVNEKYPNLMRPLNLREERFNMHQTKGSLIFEIGTHANTMEEAKRCAVYLSECICDILND